MIWQIGVPSLKAIWTKSKFSVPAWYKALRVSTMPRLLPSALINWMRGLRIAELIFCSLRMGLLLGFACYKYNSLYIGL